MKLKYGSVIIPFKDGGDTLGVRVTWDSGLDHRALAKLCIKHYKIATGRTITKEWLTKTGVLSDLKPYIAVEVDGHEA